MDEIIAEEAEIERKLKALKDKYKSNYKVNLRSIKRPEDIGVIAEREREEALKRNAEFLEELEIASAKLHTKRLCPLQKKLDELKIKCGYPTKRSLELKCLKKDLDTRCAAEKTGNADEEAEEEDPSESFE